MPSIRNTKSSAQTVQHAPALAGSTQKHRQRAVLAKAEMGGQDVNSAGITFHPSPHLKVRSNEQDSGWELEESMASYVFRGAVEGWRSRKEESRTKEIFQSSFPTTVNTQPAPPPFQPHSNGFVRSFITAYNEHHALTIRPDDVWIAILSQFSRYVSAPAHAEQLRSKFVEHAGKKELVLHAPPHAAGDVYTADIGWLVVKMGELVDQNLTTQPSFRTWITPTFSTTTPTDKIVASALMLSTFKKYFGYKMNLRCGLPRVTVLGTRSDWEDILHRVERLTEFELDDAAGYMHAWLNLLRPVLTRIIAVFEMKSPEDEAANRSFWLRAAHYEEGGSGPTFIAGWLNAFCVFDEDGKWLGRSVQSQGTNGYETDADKDPEMWEHQRQPRLVLDGAAYHRTNLNDLPPGWCDVDVKLVVDRDGGEEETIDAAFVAGSVGVEVSSSGVLDGRAREDLNALAPVKPVPASDECSDLDDDEEYEEEEEDKPEEPEPEREDEGTGLFDTLHPVNGWWIYEKNPNWKPPKPRR